MTNSAFKAKLTRSTLATARDQASAARKLARTVSYDLGWSKAVRNGAIIVGADDAASLGAWVEKLEIEVDADKAGATLRLAADSNGAQDAVFVFYLKNDDGGALEKTKMTSLESDGDWRVHEAKLSKTDVLKLKLWSTLCVEMLDRDPTVLEFKTEAITQALAGSFDCKAWARAASEQTLLQHNLQFNLKHRAKRYLQTPNLSEDLGAQFEALKRRLINEINLPSALAKPQASSYKRYLN